MGAFAEAQPILADDGADSLRRRCKRQLAIDFRRELGARDAGLAQAAGQLLTEPIRQNRRCDKHMFYGCSGFNGPRHLANPFNEIATAFCASSTGLKGLEALDQRVVTIRDKRVASGLMHPHRRRLSRNRGHQGRHYAIRPV